MLKYCRFKRLTLINFMSFGQNETVIDLDTGQSILIVGENLDIGGANGVGKTSIFNALSYALFNKPLDAITLQRLVNKTNSLKNTKMSVTLEFSKDGHEYIISRSRGAEYTVSILRDGEDLTPGKGAIELDELIVSIIGVSYELFVKTIVFSGSDTPFFKLPLNSQRQLTEELFNASVLTTKAIALRDKIRQTEQDIKIGDAVIAQQQGALQSYESHVTQAQSRVKRWDVEKLAEIEELKATNQLASTVDFDEEQHRHDRLREIKSLRAQLKEKEVQAKRDIQDLSNSVKKLEHEASHLSGARCPYCEQQYEDSISRLVEVQARLEQERLREPTLASQLGTITSRLQEIQAEILDIEGRLVFTDVAELRHLRDSFQTSKARLAELEKATNPHTEALSKLIEEGPPAVDNEANDKRRRSLDHQKTLLKLLTDKNSFLRKTIIGRSIPILNSRLNHYTVLLGLPHSVVFDSDMSCTLSEFGSELDYGNLSAGEKKRVNVALSLAFRDMVQRYNCNFNLLLVDELEAAFDQPGFDSIVRIIKEKSRDEGMSVFVISHHPTIRGRLDGEILIQKASGFSQIVSS